MKKSKLILPLALTLLLTGCAGEGGSSVSSSDSSSASSVSSSATLSSSSSSSSSVAPDDTTGGDTTGGDTTGGDTTGGDTTGGDTTGGDTGGGTTGGETGGETDGETGGDTGDKEETKATTIADLKTLAAGYVSKESMVSNGTITTKYVDTYSSSTSSTSYKYGSDSYGATLEVTTVTVNDEKSLCVVTDSNGKVLTLEQKFYKDYVLVDNGSYTKVAPKFTGYLENRTAYGVADFLNDLVAAAELNVNKDLTIASNDGTIAFSFGYYELGNDGKLGTYYSAKVSVADDKTSALTSLKVEISQYNRGCTLDASTGIVTVGKGQEADNVSTYSISQTVGERSYVCPASITNFEYKTFALKSGEADVTSESNLTFSKADSCVLSVVSTPDSANGNFDTPVVSIKKDGVDSTAVQGEFVRDSETKKETITLTASEVGTYDITVKTKNCSVSFKVTVKEAAATKLSIRRYTDYNDGENQDITKVTDDSTFVTYTGVTNYFVNTVEPKETDQKCKIKIDEHHADAVTAVNDEYEEDEEEDDDDSSEPWAVDSDDTYNGKTACSFVANVTGTYKVSISSVGTPSIKKTFTIEVRDGDTFKDILSSSEYAVRNGTLSTDPVYTFKFTPSSDANDDLTGSVSVTTGDNSATEYSYSLSKFDDSDYEDYEFTLTGSGDDEDEPDFSLILGADRNLYIQFTNSYQKLNKANSVEFALERDWSGEIDDEDDEKYQMSLTFHGNGSVNGWLKEGDEDPTEAVTEWTVVKNDNESYTIKFADDGNVTSEATWEDYFPTEATLKKDFSEIEFNLEDTDWSLK